MLRFSKSLASLALLSAVLVPGCQDAPPAPVADTHEHGEGHHHPETLADALTELTELRDTIRDAFAADDTDKAHDPLHEVGHIIEVVQELAEKEKLPEERLAIVKSSTEELFNAFGEVDKTMHGGEGSTYKDVSGKIDAAMVALKAAITGEAPAEPAAAPAGHQGGITFLMPRQRLLVRPRHRIPDCLVPRSARGLAAPSRYAV